MVTRTPKKTPIKNSPKMTRQKAARLSMSQATPKANQAGSSNFSEPVKATAKAKTPKPAAKNQKKQANSSTGKITKLQIETIEKLDDLVNEELKNASSDESEMSENEMAEMNGELSENTSEEEEIEETNKAPEKKLKFVETTSKQTKPKSKNDNKTAEKKEATNQNSTIKEKKLNNEPKDLDDNLAIIIRGINFKTSVEDIKKKLPSAKYIRMPRDTKTGDNRGFCMVYFTDKKQLSDAHAYMKKEDKILGRMCFTKYLVEPIKSKVNSEIPRLKDAIYVSPVPKNISNADVKRLFPNAEYVLVKVDARCGKMFVWLKSEQDAAKYIQQKKINIKGYTCSVDYMIDSSKKSNNNPKNQEKRNPQTNSQSTSSVKKLKEENTMEKSKKTKVVSKPEAKVEESDEISSDSDEEKVEMETSSDDEIVDDESSDSSEE
ncbi:MAG: hypothetical protein MHPSP_000408 [Paramarteilia canceri]